MNLAFSGPKEFDFARGISWNLVEKFLGVFRMIWGKKTKKRQFFSVESRGIPWNLVEKFLGVFGVIWGQKKNAFFFRGISWNSVESRGISWNLVEFRGTFLAQKRASLVLCVSLCSVSGRLAAKVGFDPLFSLPAANLASSLCIIDRSQPVGDVGATCSFV